jgi:hypothetical protein
MASPVVESLILSRLFWRFLQSTLANSNPLKFYRQVLEHRWYRCENEKRDVSMQEAVQSYVETVLAHRRDEATLMQPATGAITLPNPVPTGTIVVCRR